MATVRIAELDATSNSATAGDELPESLLLELLITDRETLAELMPLSPAELRHDYALKALRLGVLALRQARGQIDAENIRREGDRLLDLLGHRLQDHSQILHDRMTNVLRDYFDPTQGRFSERVERLVKQDGELERLLRKQLQGEESELMRNLAQHFGKESQLLQWLNPDQSQGILAALKLAMGQQLTEQREQMLRQFSLDNKDGALSRFISELTEKQGELTQQVHDHIETVVHEFSLDSEDSALSRLVANVDRAQKVISAEFSLDQETSALSRLKKMMEATNQSIHSHLSLDDESSALARLKRELLSILEGQRETQHKFQTEVQVALKEMIARKQEADRSVRHGLKFEDDVADFLQREANRLGDVAERTGSSTGLISHCKVGDLVIELGPESATPGARLVIEAKEAAGYSIKQARDELETARKNRDSQVGLFVFSRKCAPAGLDPVARFGNDVIIIWDPDELASDLYLKVGLTLARALCVRHQQQTNEQAADFTAIDAAILEIEKKSQGLEDIETWTTTIQNNSDKIRKKLETLRKSLASQIEILREKTAALKHTTDS